MVPPRSDRITRVPPYSRTDRWSTRTGLSPALAIPSRTFRLTTIGHWPVPLSLATTRGISVDVFSSGYLDVSVPRVRLQLLCIQNWIPSKGWVSPFGHPRINDRSHLPAAFRSVPRPSSPLGAKASTKCPLMLDAPISRRRSPARAENRRIPHATPSLFGPGPRRLEFSLKTRRPSHTPDHENDRPNGPASPRLMRRRSTYPLHDIIQQARPSGLATGRRVQDAAPDLGQTVICLLDHAPNPGAPDPAIPVGAIPVGATPVTPANPGEPGGGGRD